MQFNSYIFILLFFPVVCFLYYIFANKNNTQNANRVLLIGSFIFYVYAGKECLFLLLLSIIYNYAFYMGIVYCNNRKKYKVKKWILIVGILANLLLLFYFKYYNFFVSCVNIVFDSALSVREIIQPIGISFIVFQQIAFLVDASRNEIEECRAEEYALFISFFPHISSGPIILHKDLIPDLRGKRPVDWEKISGGIYMFVMGLGKKVLIADTFAQAVDWGYANVEMLNTTSALFVSIAYTIQIYFDVSGYSDMAIGISRILQLDLPVNFNSPYKAKTILEFWDRWHMTLTRFFTKYLYIPLGGSRKGKIRTYINTLIVFLCSGLWHGASFTFIIWGVLHGCFMVLTKHFIKVFSRIPDFINQCVTFMFVNFAWILFRAGSISSFKGMMSAIAKMEWGGLNENLCEPFIPLIAKQIPDLVIFGWVWVAVITIVIGVIVFKVPNVQERAAKMKCSLVNCIEMCVIAILCVLSFSGVSSFIYSYF